MSFPRDGSHSRTDSWRPVREWEARRQLLLRYSTFVHPWIRTFAHPWARRQLLIDNYNPLCRFGLKYCVLS